MISLVPGRGFEILMLDDKPQDVRRVRNALRRTDTPNHLHAARTRREALAYLRRTGRYANAPRPNLILLDVMLPKKDGFEMLADLKADDSLSDIPVMVIDNSAPRACLRRGLTTLLDPQADSLPSLC